MWELREEYNVARCDSVWAVFRTHEEVRIPDSPRPEFPSTVVAQRIHFGHFFPFYITWYGGTAIDTTLIYLARHRISCHAFHGGCFVHPRLHIPLIASFSCYPYFYI